jgi:hypothetical protein
MGEQAQRYIDGSQCVRCSGQGMGPYTYWLLLQAVASTLWTIWIALFHEIQLSFINFIIKRWSCLASTSALVYELGILVGMDPYALGMMFSCF